MLGRNKFEEWWYLRASPVQRKIVGLLAIVTTLASMWVALQGTLLYAWNDYDKKCPIDLRGK